MGLGGCTLPDPNRSFYYLLYIDIVEIEMHHKGFFFSVKLIQIIDYYRDRIAMIFIFTLSSCI